MAQARQALALHLDLALTKAVLGQKDGRRIDDDHPGVAIDDDPVILTHQLAAGARTHHGGDVHAARNDGGVRGLATHVGDETGKHALLELQQVGWGQVVRYQHQGHVDGVVQHQVLLGLAARTLRNHRMGHALHVAQDAFDHLLQVGLALTQVLVLHLVELASDDLQLGGQRPFGVVQTIGDPVLDAAGEHFILQQHQVHIQQRGQLLGGIGGNVFLQTLNFLDHRIAATAHAVDLALDLPRLDEIMRHLHAAGAHKHRAANRDTTRHRQPSNREGHAPSPGVVVTAAMLIRPRRTCR